MTKIDAPLQSLLQVLSKYVAIAACKARKQDSNCKTMLIFASNSPMMNGL